MIVPENLKPGDHVAIVATARKVKYNQLTRGLELLRSWGLRPVIGSSIGLSNHQFAGSDNERARDFQNQLDNPEIKAVWCACGGYGTVRIIDQLDFANFMVHPKWIVGYSDITVLHAHLNSLGYAGLHAQMPVNIDQKSNAGVNSLKSCLFGKPLSYHWDNTTYNRFGKANGHLIGGNLSVLYSLCGSPSIPNMYDNILFLEDLDEYLYHIDRMLQNLKRNGWFKAISGLLIGGMTNMRDNTKAWGFKTDNPFGKTAKDIIAETVRPYDFPVAYNFPAGHIADNQSLVLGDKVNLSVTENGSHLSTDL